MPRKERYQNRIELLQGTLDLRVKAYKLTALGRKQLATERSRWKQVMEGMAGILNPSGEESKA
jgi:hypothetical protein